MAVFYNEGERKVRPGLYQRHSNIGFSSLAAARDGICAIPVRAVWGPLGKVVKNTMKNQLVKNYGSGTYGTNYTIPAAEEMFNGGASVVYTYRMGTGGTKASLTASGLTFTAKYVGTMPLSVSIVEKLGDATTKVFQVYSGTTLLETFYFDADKTNEGANLLKVAAKSKYVDVTAETAPATVEVLAVASGALEGGADPTVTNEDYSKAFAALESFYFNTIALDVDDDADMTLSQMLQVYLAEAYKMGKLAIFVTGEKTDVEFQARMERAKSFNDCKVVYLGGGWKCGDVSKDGVMAICYTAGLIAATPSNKGIVHAVINGATDLCGEAVTYAEYEDAIRCGMLLPSMSPDGTIWYDAGINTLINPDEEIQDEGWKKIRRVKVRFEVIDRLDRELLPKVGRVSADRDGVGDVVQTGQRILDAMVTEGKLFSGAKFAEDPENPFEGDSAWFIIQVDDIDSLEKIYLHYQFRYSQNS